MSRLAAQLLVLAGLAAVLPAASFGAAPPAAPQAPTAPRARTVPQAPAAAPSAALALKLDTVVQQAVAAARALQQRERAVASLAGALVGADSDLATQQRALDEVRTRAAVVLAALERLARTPPEVALLAAQQPIDRIRSGIVLAAIVPSLAGEAHGLIAKQQSLAAQRAQLLAKRNKLAADRRALAKSREGLRKLIAARGELRQQILRDAAASDPRALQLGAVAADLSDLIKRADAEQAAHDRVVRPRAGRAKETPTSDPTRPKGLRVMTALAALSSPVAGPVVRHFGDTDDNGTKSQGLALDVISGGTVVAPFDGRIEYAGPFGSLGPILIIGHGGGYHSVLAGLGRIDAAIGEWIVAGEPIGVMPDAAKSDESVTIYFELRHDGDPIDPQPFLGGRDADHRVSE